MLVHIIIENWYWKYWYIDYDGHKTTVEGFDSHIAAKRHIADHIGNDVEIVYNK